MQGAGLIIFVLWIAVSNLALGIALAVAMGHGPRRLSDLTLLVPNLPLPKLPLKIPSFARQAEKELPAPEEPENEPVPSEPEVVDPEPEQVAETDDGLPLAEALAQFQLDVADVRNDLVDVTSRLDECVEAPTVEAVEECVADLKDVGQGILERQVESLQAIENAAEDDNKTVSELRQATQEQASQIQQQLDEIEQMEIRAETLEEDCQRLRDHTCALTASCENIDQSVANAKTSAEGSVTSDTPTDDEHLEQIEVSAALDDWWADDPDHQRPLTLVMVDLDHVGKLNDALGKDVVDKVLQRVEGVIITADVHGGSASMINPQRFLLLLPNVAVPKLTQEVEALREAIRAMPLEIEQDDVELTASCAIAISRSGDSASALVTRAEAALVEAKQFGGNRTFLNEGEFPTPVVGNTAGELAAAT